MNEEAWVAKPDGVFSRHPRRDFTLLRYFIKVTGDEGLPRDITNGGGVDGFIKVAVTEKGRLFAVFSAMQCPDFHQLIDIAGRHLHLAVKELSKFKLRSIGVGSPVTAIGIIFIWTGRGSGGQRCTVDITMQTYSLFRLNLMIK